MLLWHCCATCLKGASRSIALSCVHLLIHSLGRIMQIKQRILQNNRLLSTLCSARFIDIQECGGAPGGCIRLLQVAPLAKLIRSLARNVRQMTDFHTYTKYIPWRYLCVSDYSSRFSSCTFNSHRIIFKVWNKILCVLMKPKIVVTTQTLIIFL